MNDLNLSEQKAHATYSASGASRWINCSASIQESEGMPENVEQSDASVEGTNAHAFMEYALLNVVPYFESKKRHTKSKSKVLDTALKNEDWTPEMIDCGLNLVDLVHQILKKIGSGNYKLFVEAKVKADKFITKNQFGTLDIGILDIPNGVLYVVDYKFGFKFVSEVENYQFLYYALGMYFKLSSKYRIKKIINGVYQPRTYPSDEQIRFDEPLSKNELLEYVDVFKKAYRRTINKPKHNFGEWCFFCPARIKCPEIGEKGLDAIMVKYDKNTKKIGKVPNAEQLSPLQISNLLEALPRVDMFVRAVKERAYEMLMVGKKVDGYKLVDKRTVRRWKDAKKVEKRLSDLLGEEAFTKKLISPAMFEREWKTKSAKKFLSDNTTDESSGLTMVEESDKRESKNAFSDFND